MLFTDAHDPVLRSTQLFGDSDTSLTGFGRAIAKRSAPPAILVGSAVNVTTPFSTGTSP